MSAKWARNRPPAVDRANRVVFVLLGAALIAGGVVLLLLWDKQLAVNEPPVLYERAVAEVQRNPGLWWTVIIAGSAIVAIVGILWALAQVTGRAGGRSASVSSLPWGHRGSLRVQPAALARVAAQDFQRVPGVVGSKVRVIELGPTTRVFARLDLARETGTAPVTDAAEEVLGRMATAAGAESVEARLRLNLAAEDASRVH